MNKYNKKKILYVILSNHIAGTEIYVINIIKSMREKYDIEVLCKGGELKNTLDSMNIKTHISSARNNRDLISIYETYKLIKANKYDIVHTNLSTSNLIGGIAAKLAKVDKIIATEHLWSCYNEEKSYIQNKISLLIYRILSIFVFDNIIAVCDAIKRFLINEAKIKSEKIEVIRNALILEEIERKNFDSNNVVVGIIGRLEIEKGHIYAIDALEKLTENITLLIAGKGSLETTLKSKAKDKKVEFVGFLSDTSKFYKDIDILLVPSLRECMPLVIIEAMNSSIPIIATNVGGIPEVIEDGETGYLIRSKNSLEIANAINKLLDRDTYLTVSKSIKKKYSKLFNYNEMIKKTSYIYEK